MGRGALLHRNRLTEIRNRYGPYSLACLNSPCCSNEESCLLQKFARFCNCHESRIISTKASRGAGWRALTEQDNLPVRPGQCLPDRLSGFQVRDPHPVPRSKRSGDSSSGDGRLGLASAPD
jgi:hypothetical protein